MSGKERKLRGKRGKSSALRMMHRTKRGAKSITVQVLDAIGKQRKAKHENDTDDSMHDYCNVRGRGGAKAVSKEDEHLGIRVANSCNCSFNSKECGPIVFCRNGDN